MKQSDPYKFQSGHRTYHNKQENNNVALRVMVMLTVFLALVVVGLVVFSVIQNNLNTDIDNNGSQSSNNGSSESAEVIPVLPTPAPVMLPEAHENPVLFPATAQMNVDMGVPVDAASIELRGLTQDIFQGDQRITQYTRSTGLFFGDPLHFQTVPGILTFRGNNFRNCASWGSLGDSPEGELIQTWEYAGIGSRMSSLNSSYWTGTGWTGQPLIVAWDFDVQQHMNMYPEKRYKEGLVEVIQAALDGRIYFFDLEDGSQTRDPIDMGATIKGTPSIHPSGYPLLFVGQGDNNASDGRFGMYIFSLINGEELYHIPGRDARAYRGWGAADSSPLVCADTDTVIHPSENGMIYSIELNTSFDRNTGALSISPETMAYRFQLNGISGGQMGIESSIAVYNNYGYFSDNSGNLFCLDLNTFEMVWARQLDDDTDVTPVIEEDSGRLYLYTGTEVDWQRDIYGYYQGAAYTYKIDAMTGEEIWQTSYPCWTFRGENLGDSLNGGILGTPIVGKHSISHLVIFTYSMTQGAYSGNVLIAYDKDTGEQVWIYQMNMYSWSSPVDVYDDEGNAYIVMCDSIGQVHLVDGQTGERMTYLQTVRYKGQSNETTLGLNMESSPSVYNDMIVIGTRSGSIFGIRIQ